MRWWLSEMSLHRAWRHTRELLLPNLRYLARSGFGVCRACLKRTLFVQLGPTIEFRICVQCRANLRYEMLAEYLRGAFPAIASMDVLELDFSSPLRALLSEARSYTRSFYRREIAPGSVRADGAVCQDITNLTFADESLDLIVSSDVLEHVPEAAAAFRETARVLRSGGEHVFTVPPRRATMRRAALRNGEVDILVPPPEYHLDPLDRAGILVFWDYGPDLQEVFGNTGLKFQIVAGPEGTDERIVWVARKS